MKMPFIFLLFLTLSSTAFGWSGYTHGMIAKESLIDVAKEWGLKEPVVVTSFDAFLNKFSKINPSIKTRKDFAGWLKINTASPFDRPFQKEERVGGRIPPLEILSLYSRRADDGRDLNVSYDKLEQFWFGSGTKTGSQAFRHMEKPPFHPLYPLNTFGFPLGRLGQATQRAQIYFDLAVQAYRLGEPYWGWNFLGVGLHYIEDLGQPYHTAQLIPPLAIKGTLSYLQWGRKERLGWIKTVTHVVSNAHHFFEGYVDHFLSNETGFGNLWRQRLRGKTTFELFPSIFYLAKEVRDDSNRHAFDSVQATFLLTGKNLLTSRVYRVDIEDEELLEDPIPFLTNDSKRRLLGASTVSQIVLDAFAFQGKAVRTMVHQFLITTKESQHVQKEKSGQ